VVETITDDKGDQRSCHKRINASGVEVTMLSREIIKIQQAT
jgi:hypothetical protein